MIFDLVVYAFLALAVVLGFNSGLLRSMATIIGYVIAAPIALGTAPAVSYFLATRFNMSAAYSGLVLALILVVTGIIFGALLRRAVNDLVGPDVSIPDRIAGAALGAARIALVAVLIVVIFDRIIPANRQPGFLAQSKLRPYLSAGGQTGVKSLPPEVADYIDRLKRARGL
jgi:membrane protein required for colicin V production